MIYIKKRQGHYFVAIAHEVMSRDQRLENDNPIGVLRSFNQ